MRSKSDQVAQKSLIQNHTAMKMLDIDLKLILKVNIQISPPSLEAFSSGLWARTSCQPSLQQIKDSTVHAQVCCWRIQPMLVWQQLVLKHVEHLRPILHQPDNLSLVLLEGLV